MDIPNNNIITTTTSITSSSSSWDLDMTMGGNHLLLDQIHTPSEFLNPLDEFHTQLPSPTFPYNSNIQHQGRDHHELENEEEGLGPMKEMMYKIASMQPVDIDPSTIKKPKRRNVRISDDPQSIAARHRRERISERIRILQRLVPGGTKMDTASMLDEAIRYVKFLKRQVQELQANPPQPPHAGPVVMDWGSSSYSSAMGAHSGSGYGFSGGKGSSDQMG